MKVLHVIPSVSDRSGGPAQAIFPMCRALEANGIQTLIATTNDGVDLNGSGNGVVEYRNVSTVFFPSQWGKSFKFSRPMAVWLDENVEEFDLVHIHAVFNHACIAAARACRKHQVPYVVRPLGTLDPWSMKQKRLMKRAFWQLSGKRMLQGAAAVHYTTTAEKEAVEESLKLNHGNVVPLGLDLEIAEAQSKTQSQTLQPPENPYVLVLSRLHPKKGLEILIEAFLRVVRQDELQNWRLVLAGVGSEDYVRRLKQMALTSDGSERIAFPGWLEGETKNLFLRRASLLALTSYQENFGLCVLEALSCGVPVLVSPQVNLAEAIEEAGAGWIAAVEPDALAETLREAFATSSERLKRGEAGRVMSLRFTWPEVSRELLAMYSRILSN